MFNAIVKDDVLGSVTSVQMEKNKVDNLVVGETGDLAFATKVCY